MSESYRTKILKHIGAFGAVITISAMAFLSVNAEDESGITDEYITETESAAEEAPDEILSETKSGGWYTDDTGRTFFIDENNEALTGYQIIEGEEYYFAANGVRKSGWYTIDDVRMYFSPENGQRQYEWIDYNENRYYAGKTGKYTGICEIGDVLYIFDSNGILMSGWAEYEGNKYYADENGCIAVGEQEIDGVKYLFSSMGKFKSGWQTVDGLRIFYDYNETTPVYGWINYNDCIYYADEITGKYKGESNISGLKYKFTDEGVLCTGFQKFSDGIRYYTENGKAVKGFLTLSGKRYYFDEKYLMKTGWQTIGVKKYYFDNNGAMQTGFQTISGKKYYFDNNGVMQTGWLTTGGKKYYLDKNGALQTGWQTIDNNKYYFDSNGIMQTGWQNIDGKKYYFNQDGVMQTGYWKTSGGLKSYIDADGTVYKNGVFQIDDSSYFFDKNGIMQSGWQKIDGDYYLFDRLDGKRQSGCTVDGITIKKDGKAVIDNWSKSKIETMMTARRIMSEQTKPTDSMEEKRLKCFNWVMSFPYRRFRILSDVYHENDWEMTFANDIFFRHQGCCVAEAAATAFLFREIGYTDVAVSHDTGHAWTEIGKYLYDPLLAEAREFDRYYNVLKPDGKLTYERRVIG